MSDKPKAIKSKRSPDFHYSKGIAAGIKEKQGVEKDKARKARRGIIRVSCLLQFSCVLLCIKAVKTLIGKYPFKTRR